MKKGFRFAILALSAVLISATALAGHAMYEGFRVVHVVVNGQPVVGDVPAVNFHGRTVLPVRAVADALGADVQWDEATWTVTLTTKTPAPTDAVYTDEYVSISNVTIKPSDYLTEVLLEATSQNSKRVSGFLSVTFYDKDGAILGTATGAVNELAPGATKTVTLMTTDLISGYAKYKVQADTMFTH